MDGISIAAYVDFQTEWRFSGGVDVCPLSHRTGLGSNTWDTFCINHEQETGALWQMQLEQHTEFFFLSGHWQIQMFLHSFI